METDVGWSGGEEMGLNRAPVITSQPLVRSRFRKESHPPSLALEETSGYSSQVLSAEKGAVRTWATAGLLWTQELQEVTRAVLTAGQALLWIHLLLPAAPELCTQCPHFHRHRKVNWPRSQERKWQSWDLNLDTWFKILNSPWIWHCTLDPRGME